MKITFPYARVNIDKLPPNEKEAIRNVFPEKQYIIQPRISFALTNPSSGKLITIQGIIDSGADYCFFNHEIAEFLEIQIKKGKPVNVCGVGGICIAYFHSVRFEFRFSSSKDSIKYGVNAGFFPKENPFRLPCLLGQYGFFDYFKVSFDLPNYNIEIEPTFH